MDLNQLMMCMLLGSVSPLRQSESMMLRRRTCLHVLKEEEQQKSKMMKNF